VIGSIKQAHGNSVYLSIRLSSFRCVKRSCTQGVCNELAVKTISDALAEATKGITRFQSHQSTRVYTRIDLLPTSFRSSDCRLRCISRCFDAVASFGVICRSSIDRAWCETRFGRFSKLNFHSCLMSKINYRSDLIVRTSLHIHCDLRNVSPLLLSNTFQISFRKEREREREKLVSYLSATLDPFPIICHQLDISGHSNIDLILTYPLKILFSGSYSERWLPSDLKRVRLLWPARWDLRVNAVGSKIS